MTNTYDSKPSKPWHKEPWAWFVLAPLITVVISCTVTVTIAVTNADDRVVDNYYKEGRLINDRMEEDLAAARLDLSAQVIVDQVLGELIVRLQKTDEDYPEQLFLEVSHPLVKEFDQQYVLQHIARGQYQTEIDEAFQYRWYLRLRPELMDTLKDTKAVANNNHSEKTASNALWRLRGEIDFSTVSNGEQVSILLTPEI